MEMGNLYLKFFTFVSVPHCTFSWPGLKFTWKYRPLFCFRYWVCEGNRWKKSGKVKNQVCSSKRKINISDNYITPCDKSRQMIHGSQHYFLKFVYAVWSIINVNKVIFVCLSFNKRSKTVNHDCFQGVPGDSCKSSTVGTRISYKHNFIALAKIQFKT